MVARVRGAVIHIELAQPALEALCAATLVAIWLVHALGSIPAGCACTFINIQLTQGTAEA